MDPVTVTVLSGALAGGGLLRLWRLRDREAAWLRAAQSCGLSGITVRRTLGIVTGLRGRLGRLQVSLRTRVSSRMAGATTIQVRGIADVALRAEGRPDTVVRRSLGSTALQVGDPVFDAPVYLEGAPEVLQALLDATTRLAVRRLLEGMLLDPSDGTVFRVVASLNRGIDLQAGEGDPRFARRDLPRVLHGVLDLARRLEPPEDVAQRLARNAREDPLPEVRRRNLVMLVHERPHDPATATALRPACADGDEEVRLYAARQLGAGGHAVLRKLAEEAGSDSCAARAIRGLGLALAADEALQLLSLALPPRRYPVVVACIEALAGRGGEATVAALERIITGERGQVAVAAAKALGFPGLTGAETVLVGRGLAHENGDVRVAAAVALGRVGTVSAVLPLREIDTSGRWDVGGAAREAIAAIQARLKGAAPGQLSVPAHEGGTVSLATDGGELSLDGGHNPGPRHP